MATVAAAALVLSGCSSDAKKDDNAGISTDTAVNIAWNQPFYSFNGNSITGNATANNVILYLLQSHFNYYDADLNLINDTSFGTMEKVSDDPLQVKYTYADTATWSDGTPAGPADLLLEWAGQSGKFNNVEPEYDEETGDVTNQAALDAGVYFDGATPSVALITDTPVIEGNSITLTYSKPFADWQVSIDNNLPAHIVAKRALGIDDPTEAAAALVDAIDNNKVDDLSKIAKVWSNDFNYVEMPTDPDLYVSSGAYVLSEYKKDQFLTLKANPEYKGDNKATIPTVTVRYNGDPMSQVQALSNGEVDLINPQSTSDVLTAVKALDGIKVETGTEGTYEHIDLQFANGGPFDPATYGGDADKAHKVREAFLKTVPRQEIIDKLIKPLDPEATIRNSFTIVPGAPDYASVSEVSGQAAYDVVDIEGAKALLAEAGVASPTVRVLFDPDNTRRVNQFDLMVASAKEAGINVVAYEVQDGWGSDLSSATSYYDAALFGWQSTSTAVTESDANYRTGATNNFYGYSNAEVDALFDQLQVETVPAKQVEILGQVEKHLVDDAFGLTIFQFPGVTASRESALTGVVPLTIAPGIFYGFWDWSAGSAAASK
ncbi:peptide/nickel transport system substrate-binding protein [Sanguibacter gelidistatuariae]|uniref:Peptide/nickel transport system substrate-binding protein n=1 Tax=Sanguibacter gelidistatuariae TaxID=1814289 RepID=A0A1G6MEI6_9MICO|nr:ABC transporter family substrate-binding protein [Sanguibacter gelidistatuariae]SDC53375.1 peptide/nickel transport system substrate-binding protein [Sanguibacter gelidistatuariae]